jgi:hypothetical protein
VFSIVVAVIFQSAFCLKILQNNIFFLKNIIFNTNTLR